MKLEEVTVRKTKWPCAESGKVAHLARAIAHRREVAEPGKAEGEPRQQGNQLGPDRAEREPPPAPVIRPHRAAGLALIGQT